MKMSLDEKIAIAQKYCLAPGGCPKLRGKTDYNERLTTCASCNNYLHKIDLIELLQHYTTTDTPTTTIPKPKTPPKGKSTELSKTQIKKILLLHSQGYTKNKIATELTLHFTTVKNVIESGFKNEQANEKVKIVKNEMINDGLI